jgi:RES domain-containing protein
VSEIVVWRLCASHREPWAFSGEGSARRAGRWNPLGVRVVYCAESRALAAMEVLVNVDAPNRLFLTSWIMIPATLPVDAIEKPARVRENWRQTPHSSETQNFGAAWAKDQRSVALRVPSAVVPGEFNYLLNPAHPEFHQVKIGKPERFTFDPRLGS